MAADPTWWITMAGPLMIYDFLKHALAPVSLSLRFASNRYDPATGLEAELWLVSDAPGPDTRLALALAGS